MISRAPRFAAVLILALTLSACSAASGADAPASTEAGSIELAVSETCAEGSDPQCVPVGGESILLPSTFEQAGVDDAAVAEGEGQNAIDVTLSEEGAELLHALTKEAAGAGQTARLVVRIGDDVLAAVQVMQALKGDQVQIALSPVDNAQDVVDLLLRS